MKKFFLTASALLLSTLAMTAADPVLTLDGTGTETDPYLIKDKNDILTLAAACNGATSTTAGKYTGKYFSMTADIDMAGVEGFLGIATAPADKATSITTWNFQGIFNGNGHRIKNMTIKGVKYNEDGSVITAITANNSRRYVGLFGTIGATGQVMNVIIDSTCNIEAYSYAGGIAGYAAQESYILNCANYANITVMDSYAGGIVGYRTTTSVKAGGIVNCFNAGKIMVNGSYGGGISGYSAYGEVSNCANVGEIIGDNFNPCKTAFNNQYIGGICGSFVSCMVTNCFNAGDVYAMKQYAGGIGGSASEVTGGWVSSCMNVGFVYGALGYYCGNIIGYSTDLKTTSNVYYDAQLSNSLFGPNNTSIAPGKFTGLETAKLISGETLVGLETWVYKAGSYPIPSSLNYPELISAAATYVNMPAGQDANLLTGTATTSTGTSVGLTIPSELFTVSGNSITAHPALGDSVAVFTLTNGNFLRHLLISTYSIPFSGEGTEASPYLINNKEDLISLAKLTNYMRLTFEGKYLKLTSDLDMKDETRFMGIAVSPDTVNNFGPRLRLSFRGNFDGGNHKVSNLVCKWVNFDENGNYISWREGGVYSAGFFGSLADNAVVRNLHIDNTCTFDVYYYSGGIASSIQGPASIDNCQVGATINAYSRYVGGIVGQDYGNCPVTISNCLFYGTINANYDYVGGIIGYNCESTSEIVNCVNTGKIVAYKFDNIAVGTNSTATLNRIGGIAGACRGKMTGCASYGPIVLYPHPYASPKMAQCGGLIGQIYNADNNTSVEHNFTSSQVYVTSPFIAGSTIGALIGDYYYLASAQYGNASANYCDTTLNSLPEVVDSITNGNTMPAAFHGLATSDLTSGLPIDSLAEYFSFEKGYYPMPKVFANNELVRAAASTFMNVTMSDGGKITNLFPGARIYFNDVMPLTGTLETEKLFSVNTNSLKVANVEEIGSDVLTLTNGYFQTIYPVTKNSTMNINSVDTGIDPIVSTVYYSSNGIRILNPEPGTTVVAVSQTLSGKRVVRKVVVR